MCAAPFMLWSTRVSLLCAGGCVTNHSCLHCTHSESRGRPAALVTRSHEGSRRVGTSFGHKSLACLARGILPKVIDNTKSNIDAQKDNQTIRYTRSEPDVGMELSRPLSCFWPVVRLDTPPKHQASSGTVTPCWRHRPLVRIAAAKATPAQAKCLLRQERVHLERPPPRLSLHRRPAPPAHCQTPVPGRRGVRAAGVPNPLRCHRL